MKERIYKSIQMFSRAIIQPVMFMTVTGLFIAIAAALKIEQMPKAVIDIGNFFFKVLSKGVISQLPLIFCVGITAALAKKKKTDAAIMGVTVFLIYIYANNTILTLTDRLAKVNELGSLSGTGQAMVLGVQITDMGVFLGILLGCVSAYVFNKLCDVKFHSYISMYEGTRFAFLVMIFVSIALAVVLSYVWPVVNTGITHLVNFIASTGPFGLFVYGFANRMLLPFGLHHLLWMPLYYTPLGGTAHIAGGTYSGALNIWLAEIGNVSSLTSIDPSVGYLANFGYIALPIGIALALIKTARPENKDKVKGVLLPAVFAAVIAGITEPIEFIFLFVSPILWVAHGVIYGLGLVLSKVFGLNIMIHNIIDTIMYVLIIPMNLGRQWLIPILLVILTALEYFVFVFIIKKLDIKTIGREIMDDDDLVQSTGELSESKNEALGYIVEGLGGVDNIVGVNNCITRLRIDIVDNDLVNESIIKKYKNSGIIKKNKHIQIIIGVGVDNVKENLVEYIKSHSTK
jgi:PTS system arbutin-like IIC component